MAERKPEPIDPAAQAAIKDAALQSGWSHRHRDVSGGWLRPTVFGAVDGLVTNASLIAGVGGGGGTTQAIVLTGLGGLVAGAFSMGTGEYVSVTNQNELVHAEAAVERMHEQFPDAEQAELAETFRGYGADVDTARRRWRPRCRRIPTWRCGSTPRTSWAWTPKSCRPRCRPAARRWSHSPSGRCCR